MDYQWLIKVSSEMEKKRRDYWVRENKQVLEDFNKYERNGYPPIPEEKQ